MSHAYWNPEDRTVYGSHDSEPTLGSPNIYGESVVPRLIPAAGEVIHFTKDPIVFTPNGSAMSHIHEEDRYVGDVPWGQTLPKAGEFWVKQSNGEIIQTNVDDIGKGINAIGEGLAQVGRGIVKSTNHLAWSDEFQYQEETTPTARLPPATYQPIYLRSSGTTSTFEPNHWYHLSGTWDAGTTSGPMRTATYEATGDTAGYATINWHVDDLIQPGQAVVWDGDTMRAHMNYNQGQLMSQKVIDKANKKSLKLLKKWLSPEEYQYLMEDGNLELPSQYEKDTIYIINKDPMKRIGIKKKGKVVEKSLCIHTEHSYAVGDQLLANIMLLKTDEKKFLKTANVHHMFA